LEQIDQPEGVALKDVVLNPGPEPSTQFQEEFQKDLLGGILLLRHAGAAYGESAEHSHLYFRYSGEARTSNASLSNFHSVLRLGQSYRDSDAGLDAHIKDVNLGLGKFTARNCSA
jgi:hypothetical protein